ncbi:MAG: ribonuclease III domain-containing protein [Bulleidia sp.]|nr:ribonuclease III domain-containing protein [Bulleidia sp.]
MRMEDCPGRTLAFLGDAAWSETVRRHLIENGYTTGSSLQKQSISYVSAKAQALFYDAMHEEGFLSEEEEEYFRRGRNSNAGSVPHGTPVSVYRRSTGFEALIGYLDVSGKRDRIEEIWNQAEAIRRENP